VWLAEAKSGPIPRPANLSYIWGDALDEFERMTPDLRIINLETSITKSDEYWRGKEIHYRRLNPGNIGCLTAAKIGYCSLSNNHVLDWGYSGLIETIETLTKANIKSSGAGKNIEEAQSPAVLEVNEQGKVIIFSLGSETSGIPLSWAASKNKPGVNPLGDLSERSVHYIKKQVEATKSRDDVAVASIHWVQTGGMRSLVNSEHSLINSSAWREST
jgi:poly-gamma-glutamate capsule biosynthesis protein CapA/YwtB (metallophosphatase superfamily)